MNSPQPIRLLINGASGRMGRALLRLAKADPRFAVVAAIARSRGTVDGMHALTAADGASAPAFDVLVDFSLPAAFDAALELCVQRGCALVSGTTGLSDAQCNALNQASSSIPIVWTANFSIGVVVLTELARRASAPLADWDCDIVESHHTSKQDAPSGTALMLGQAIEHAGHSAPTFASIRAGDIVGEHCVQFTGPGERLELTHRATDRNVFARGALEAAARISGRRPGQYGFGELLLG